MNNLNQILDMWKDKKDIAEMISSGISFNPDQVQAYLNCLPPEEKEKATNLLKEMLGKLPEYIKDLEGLKAETKAQIEQNIKHANACLSYGATEHNSKKDK